MKILKTKTTALCLILTLIVLSFTTYPAICEMKSFTDRSYFEEYFESVEFSKTLNAQLVPDVNVKIYDEIGNLIAAGDEENDKIKSYIGISDLMTEVGGTKLFRLSHRSMN